MGELRIMGKKGDVKVIWDKKNEDEVEAAEEQFNRLVKEKDFNAFKVNKDGNKGRSVKTFNPDEERYIMVPQLQGG
jgi:hypothetical protein